jgi:hypothetical protein
MERATQKIRHDASGANITTAAWTELSASLTKSTSAIEVYNGTDQTLVLGVGAAASEAELNWYIIPGGNGKVPCNLTAGSRLAVKAVGADATTGALVLNLFE